MSLRHVSPFFTRIYRALRLIRGEKMARFWQYIGNGGIERDVAKAGKGRGGG